MQARGTRVVRLDPGAGPMELDVRLDGGRWVGEVADQHRAARLGHVISGLWRWPTKPSGHPGIAEPAERAWAAREDERVLCGVLRALPIRWVNHPARFAAANEKAGQLVTARACGLAVPATLYATSGDAVRAWARGRGPLLYKAQHAQGTGEDAMVAATAIDPAGLPAGLGAMSCIQEVVPGPSMRVTVVGRELFAVRVDGARELDWRPEQNRLTFTPADVPAGVEAGTHAYMRAYGLEYGAFDFISADDGWVFLECNPSGMYGFAELLGGLPITAALADLLQTPLPGNESTPRLGDTHGR